MTWENVTHIIDKIADKPIVIAVVTALTLVMGALVIFAKTSLGKKALKSLMAKFLLTDGQTRECAKIANDALEKVKNVETLAKDRIKALESEYDRKANELKQEYEQKLAISVSIVNYYVESTVATLKLIPNVKVQEQVTALEAGYEQKKKEITQTIGAIYQDYSDVVKTTTQEIRKEYQAKIEFLENKVNEMGLFLIELKEGKNYGQGEESQNSNPTSETI